MGSGAPRAVESGRSRSETVKRISLNAQILLGLVLGGCYGFFFGESVDHVAWLGDVFLRALRMLIVPLVVTAIASGVASIGGGRDLGRIGLKTIGYYGGTSFLAACLGLLLVNVLRPGVGVELGFDDEVAGLELASKSFGSTLVGAVPDNLLAALASNNMLQVIFLAFLFGYSMSRLSTENGRLLIKVTTGAFELMMQVTLLVMRLAPLGVFGLVASVVARQASDLLSLSLLVSRLGLFVLVVLLGLGLHAGLTLPLLLKLLAGINPLKHVRAMAAPLLTAFSTASSSATLPLTMEVVEKRAGVSNRISSFVLPLGATINMDGTALYECIAALFIAQAYGIELGLSQQMIVIATALLVSVGAAGIPMAGLVMMSMVLTAVGLPLEGIGLVLGVETLLGMCRTAVNVWGDSCGAVIIARSEGERLRYDNGG